MNAERITAQVAVEAIINAPDAFDPGTVEAVSEHAERVGVPQFYLNLLDETIEGLASL